MVRARDYRFNTPGLIPALPELHVDDERRTRSSALSGIFTSGRRPQGFSSTLLKVPIERVQIDAIKFERTQIHFFTDVFTAVIVVLA